MPVISEPPFCILLAKERDALTPPLVGQHKKGPRHSTPIGEWRVDSLGAGRGFLREPVWATDTRARVGLKLCMVFLLEW